MLQSEKARSYQKKVEFSSFCCGYIKFKTVFKKTKTMQKSFDDVLTMHDNDYEL